MKMEKILITGASSGIGLAVANRLLQNGADVVNLSRSTGGLKDSADTQRHARTIPCDISDYSSIVAAISILQKERWTPDVLINNAGIALGAPKVFWEQPVEDIHKVIGVNVIGIVNVTHA